MPKLETSDQDSKEGQTVGEAAAEKEKEEKAEKKRKRHAQWARFMRTLQSWGPMFKYDQFEI